MTEDLFGDEFSGSLPVDAVTVAVVGWIPDPRPHGGGAGRVARRHGGAEQPVVVGGPPARRGGAQGTAGELNGEGLRHAETPAGTAVRPRRGVRRSFSSGRSCCRCRAPRHSPSSSSTSPPRPPCTASGFVLIDTNSVTSPGRRRLPAPGSQTVVVRSTSVPGPRRRRGDRGGTRHADDAAVIVDRRPALPGDRFAVDRAPAQPGSRAPRP